MRPLALALGACLSCVVLLGWLDSGELGAGLRPTTGVGASTSSRNASAAAFGDRTLSSPEQEPSGVPARRESIARSAVVRGRVVHARSIDWGEPVQGANAEVYRVEHDTWEFLGESRSRSDGSFEVELGAAGNASTLSLRVRFSRPGYFT